MDLCILQISAVNKLTSLSIAFKACFFRKIRFLHRAPKLTCQMTDLSVNLFDGGYHIIKIIGVANKIIEYAVK